MIPIVDPLKWLEEIILNELDAIIDDRSVVRGVTRTPAQKQAGREAMRKRVAPLLTNETVAHELMEMGELHVRAAVRRMYSN